MSTSSCALPAIVLAAGLSSRMGSFKPLLPLRGVPLIHHVLNALGSSQAISEVLLITGHRAEDIISSVAQFQNKLPPSPEPQFPATNYQLQSPFIRPLHNPAYATGEMLSSLLTGINALPSTAPAFLLALADHPAILPSTITRLVQAFFSQNLERGVGGGLQSPAYPIVVPTITGKRGHPVILSTALVPEIRSLAPGESLKTVVHRHLAHVYSLPVEDPAILLDLDTPADVDRAQALLSPTEKPVPPPSP